MNKNHEAMAEFDALYMKMFDAVKDFYRFAKRNPGSVDFDDDYYTKTAETLKGRIDFELIALHEPTIV